MPPKFQRARKPEEREVRRQAILRAARKLLSEVPAADVGLNELARRSRVSKPNVYRYFESREHVLLEVWIEQVRELREGLEGSLGAVARGDVEGVVAAVVEGFASRPRLCELQALVAPVLERNISATVIVAAKWTHSTLTLDIARLLHGRLPGLSVEACAWAAEAAATWVAGIWPAADPPPPAVEALARPELAGMAVDFRRDFARFLRVVFAGLRAGAG